MFASDDETDALLRLSTSQADARDWDAAIATLRIVQERLIISPVHYPTETWCKLPLYFSRAGRFDESMASFDWLLADLPRRARKECFMDDPSVSFGSGTTKRQVYNLIVRAGKKVIKDKRAVALRRKEKAGA